jgi:hypothetical protein
LRLAANTERERELEPEPELEMCGSFVVVDFTAK